ncbi:MAG TPA: LLM class flavin-dependent oxidoreductase, partial [Nitrolancea sp.]|nr:LLM class flavin-dependent oxidoreductase [Nitrolancea sp.]
FRGPEFPPLGNWECWTTAAAIGAATSRVEIGTLVSSTSFRPPAVLAAMANTIDDLTDGRLILGLGAGDAEKEHLAMGIPFEQRVGRFEEALTILRALFREGESSVDGRFYQTRACQLLPAGPRAGGPPFLIGALAQSPRMLRLTAQYADIWNVTLTFGRSRPDVVPPLRTAVDAACRKYGRDPATLARSAAVLVDCTGFGWYPEGLEPLVGSPEELAESFRAFAREGISHLQVATYPATIEGIEELAPVLEILDGD